MSVVLQVCDTKVLDKFQIYKISWQYIQLPTVVVAKNSTLKESFRYSICKNLQPAITTLNTQNNCGAEDTVCVHR